MRLNKPARATFITCESNIYTHLRKCVTAVAEQEELCWFEDFFYDHSKPSSKSAANYNRNVFSCDNYCIQNGGLKGWAQDFDGGYSKFEIAQVISVLPNKKNLKPLLWYYPSHALD